MHMRKLLGAAVAAALITAMPVPSAQADTYAPGSANQDFAGGPGGWNAATATEGLCVPVLLCPAVANDWTGGGADGNGYIRTRFTSLATTLAGSSTGVWTSPAFTYDGMAGKKPASVTFDMNMANNLGALLGLDALNTASYSVSVVDTGTGTGVGVVNSAPITNTTGWASIPTASVNPDLLKVGRSYSIRITTRYNAVAAVIGGGEVGYDNVKLTTLDKFGNSDGKDGANGGSGITTRKELRSLTKSFILPGSAKMVGNKVKMRLRCPAKAAPHPCKIQVTGLAKGKFSKAATARKFVTLKAGKKRFVKIRVKPAYVAKYKASKKVWVKSTVRVGNVRVTVRKRVKLK